MKNNKTAILLFFSGIIVMALSSNFKLEALKTIQEIGRNRFGGGGLLEWAYDNIRLRVGGATVPFNLEGHEPLMELYQLDDHPFVASRKCGQYGSSTRGLIRALYLAVRLNLKVGYYFPTDTDVEDFVLGRANPMIDDSPLLTDLMQKSRTDNTSVKRINNSVIYFRGVWTKRKVKAIDLDMVYKDELDEANQENMVFAEDRLLHSKFGWIEELSQPSVDDYGIDATFKTTDQRYWTVKCGCGHYNQPDKNFPECLMTRGQTVYIGCVKCSRKLDLARGEWVADFPSLTKDRRGYQQSWLHMPFQDKAKIKTKWDNATTTIKKKNFYISILGLPYSSSNTKPITDEVLNNCQGDTGFLHDAKFSYFGMDVGDKCHLVFGAPTGMGAPRLILAVELEADDEAGIIRLMKRMGVYSGVIDAMPYKTLAKNIARGFDGRVYINYYKGDTLKTGTEGEGQFEVPKVGVNRDESLDETVDMLREGRIILPDPKKLSPEDLVNYEQFRSQCKMLIKDPEDKNGIVEYHYKKQVPNHFGMGLNYMRIAMELSHMNIVTDVDPIGVELSI